MNEERFCYGDNGLDAIDIPDHNPFDTDMCYFGGMTQEELEKEIDRQNNAEE